MMQRREPQRAFSALAVTACPPFAVLLPWVCAPSARQLRNPEPKERSQFNRAAEPSCTSRFSAAHLCRCRSAGTASLTLCCLQNSIIYKRMCKVTMKLAWGADASEQAAQGSRVRVGAGNTLHSGYLEGRLAGIVHVGRWTHQNSGISSLRAAG